MPEDIAEEAPRAGTAYILFVTSRPGGDRAIKMLWPTEANLDAVRELLPRTGQAP